MTGRHIVTGGSGFVGERLAAALHARGEPVIIFDPAEPKGAATDWVCGDVRQPDDLRKLAFGPGDTVYHLAARQFHGPVPRQRRDAWFADVNASGTRRLLDAMASGGTRQLVFFSTDMTYGRPDLTPVPPDHPLRPIGPYGRSKRAAELMIRGAADEFGLRATVFRPRLIAGAGRLGILARLFRLIELGLPVPMIGSGRNRYQMIAVEDCVAAALRAVERGLPAGPFNLGSDEPPTVRELLADLIARAGSRSMLLPTPARAVQAVLAALDGIGATLLYPEQYAIADADYVLDTSATRAALDWTPARRDQDIIFDAYRHFAGARHATSTRLEQAAASSE